MSLQIELKPEKIVVMSEVFGQRLRIVYKDHGKETSLFMPMSIIKAFGNVCERHEITKENL